MNAEQKLSNMGIVIPTPVLPIAQYVPVKQAGNFLFVSGQAAIQDGALMYKGRLGENITIEEGYQAARIAAINILAALKEYLGSLDKVKSVVKVNGFVACCDDFSEQPKVINGASDLLAEVFEPNGKHARSAVGLNALPLGTPVEVEAIFEI